MLKLLEFSGNANVGVFARATESHAFIPAYLSDKDAGEVEEALEVDLVRATVGGTTLLGSLVAGNSTGLVVSDIVGPRELDALRATGLRVEVFAGRPNAVGNSLLVTNEGALCNPAYDEHARAWFEDVLGVPLVPGTLGGHGTVGMAGVATASGVLVHPKATPEERESARRAFGHEVMIGTINHGTALVGAGLVANRRGAVIGAQSTAIEVGRIEDALGFLPPQPASRR